MSSSLWLGGVLLLGAAAVGMAGAEALSAPGQKPYASPVTVNYEALRSANGMPAASGSSVVLPLIFPDGSLAAPFASAPQRTEAEPEIVLIPPSTGAPAASAPVEPAAHVELASVAPVAAIAPKPETEVTPNVTVPFRTGAGDISPDGLAALDALASKLLANNERVQLRAYAGLPGDLASDSRRMSLKRALAVRAYLMGRGVDATRIDVQALGGATTGKSDRVDIVLASS